MALPDSLRLLPAVAAVLVLLLLAPLGCSSKPPQGHDCPGPRAAFHVTITAKNGPLPADTVVKVAYGGGIEEYDLASPPDQPEVVFCDRVQADAGAGQTDGGTDDAGNVASGPVEALTCSLWTNAAATIDIDGSGYPVLEQQLEAEKDDCGIKTVEYTLVLGAGDGGI